MKRADGYINKKTNATISTKNVCAFPQIFLPRADLLLVLLLILYFARVVGLSFPLTEQHYTSWECDSESKTKVVPEKL